MVTGRVLVSGWTATVLPLIQEARDRQRRRRLMLAQLAVLATVLGLATAASHRGGPPPAPAALGQPAAAQAEVRAVVEQFDRALAVGNFSRACGLLDPWMGVTTVRSSTNEVGARGSCEQRLATFVNVIGPQLVNQLEAASMSSVEVAGSEASGFTAAGRIQVTDEAVRANTWAPVVAVAKNSANARVLIICPPLLCASGFLDELVAGARSRSGRS